MDRYGARKARGSASPGSPRESATAASGQPCPDVDPMEARDALVRLVGEPVGVSPQGHVLVEGPPMQCLSEGDGRHERTSASCVSPKGGDVNCAMVASGFALRLERFWRDHRCMEP
jgi:hypothetical protein